MAPPSGLLREFGVVLAGARPKPTDFTGRERARLQKEHSDDLKRVAEQMTIATAVEAEEIANTVTDYTTEAPLPTVIDSVEDVGVSLANDWEVIQVIEDLENVTIGAGNHMTFQAGRKYKVTAHVAQHLREKGYVL